VAAGSNRIYVEVGAANDAAIKVREKATFLGLRR